MKWKCATLAMLVMAVSGTAEDTPKAKLKPFQGEWKILAITRDGQPVPEDRFRNFRLIVKGKERIIKSGDMVVSKATYTVDPTKKPPVIDISVSDGPLAGSKVQGIYELKGDKLTICLALEGDDRPDALTAEAGSGRLLQVFERNKD